MKICFFAALLLIVNQLPAQVLIHGHNDYEKPVPLFNALSNRVFAVEADVYLVGVKLAVAHERKQIDTTRTLTSLYLQPLDSLFKANRGYVSADKSYRPALVVDIKADGEKTLQELLGLVKAYPGIFDKSRSPGAIYILVSGDRGPIAGWKNYPAAIRFDGRPSEVYDVKALEKVVTISESYSRYMQNSVLKNDSLQAMITRAHTNKKLVRLWGAPDFPSTWEKFHAMGIDIINTDKVAECRQAFAVKK